VQGASQILNGGDLVFRDWSNVRLFEVDHALAFGSKGRAGMPQGDPLCKRCHSGSAVEGDTWCSICSCSQLLSDSARHRFYSAAHRALCEELVRQTARQVQGVIKLDRQVQGEICSLSDRLRNTKERLNEITNQVSRSAAAKSKADGRDRLPSVKREEDNEKDRDRRREPEEKVDFGSESSEEETGEEDHQPRERPGDDAGPVNPPSDRGKEAPRSPSRAPPPAPEREERERSRSRHKSDKKKNRNRRGGKKHQQNYRGLYQPDQSFHHHLPVEPLDLGSRPRRHSHRS